MNIADSTNRSEMKWYVIKVQSNREKSIRDSLTKRVKREGMDEMFGQILVPVEKLIENKSGKKRVTEQKLFPGYLLIEMILNEETWFLIRSVSGVGDFTGSGGNPTPMHDTEISRILAHQGSITPLPVVSASIFQPGDAVTIKDGAFEGFKGIVDSVDDSTTKATVLIEIFGRPTPIDLESWQLGSD
jgi:transcriptional antiterminator NusG